MAGNGRAEEWGFKSIKVDCLASKLIFPFPFRSSCCLCADGSRRDSPARMQDNRTRAELGGDQTDNIELLSRPVYYASSNCGCQVAAIAASKLVVAGSAGQLQH